MKLMDFVDSLKSLDEQWFLTDEGAVSAVETEECPIWQAYRCGPDHDRADEDDYPEDVHEAGRALGLTDKQITRFIRAADNNPQCDQKIRQRLLALVKSP